jgi:hypothetical protein
MARSHIYIQHAQTCDDRIAESLDPHLTATWRHARRSWQSLLDQQAREDARNLESPGWVTRPDFPDFNPADNGPAASGDHIDASLHRQRELLLKEIREIEADAKRRTAGESWVANAKRLLILLDQLIVEFQKLRLKETKVMRVPPL